MMDNRESHSTSAALPSYLTVPPADPGISSHSPQQRTQAHTASHGKPRRVTASRKPAMNPGLHLTSDIEEGRCPLDVHLLNPQALPGPTKC